MEKGQLEVRPFWLACGEPLQSRGVHRRRRPLAGHVLLSLELLTRNFVHSNSQTKFRSSLIFGLAIMVMF
jgi:hypothetical protein